MKKFSEINWNKEIAVLDIEQKGRVSAAAKGIIDVANAVNINADVLLEAFRYCRYLETKIEELEAKLEEA